MLQPLQFLNSASEGKNIYSTLAVSQSCRSHGYLEPPAPLKYCSQIGPDVQL